MKRLFQWMMAAILICGATTFTSCTNEDNPATPDLNVAEKIIGKWIETDINGQPAATNAKRVYTFVSTTKAYLSASLTMRPEYGACWSDQVEANVAIDGNKVTLYMYLTGGQIRRVEGVNSLLPFTFGADLCSV